MNSAYMGKLMELAQQDQRVVHLLADSGTGYDEMFRRNFPDRIYNFGIGEENMVGAAAGMAAAGKMPFVFTAGAFLAYRAMEFIRDDICFQNLDVKVVGMGSGLSWSSLGPTHHTTEDVSVLRAIPNLMLLSPATPNQVKACIQRAYDHRGPVYIKIGMNREKEFFSGDYVLPPEGQDVLKEGRDLAVYVTGSILEEAYRAAERLEEDGLRVKLVNVAVLKPFDRESATETAAGIPMIFTIEEHNVCGGLGSLMAESLAYRGVSAKVCPIGIEDRFAEGYGTRAAVRKANGLDADAIYGKIKGMLDR